MEFQDIYRLISAMLVHLPYRGSSTPTSRSSDIGFRVLAPAV
jgi:hypothetical protein